MLFQFIFGVAYVMLVRYGDSANAKNMSNQIHGENQEEELRKNLDKYPCKLSVGKIRQTFISILYQSVYQWFQLKPFCPHFIVIIDIHMMLIGGFGFLMTFLKRYGFSSLGLTFIVVTVTTEWAILLRGFTHMDDSFTIKLTILE